MSSSDPSIDGYWRQLDGWLSRTDFALMRSVLAHQSSQALRGDALEIGCYLGKTTIAIGTMLEESETMVVCDVFENDGLDLETQQENLRSYRPFTEAMFRENYLRFASKEPAVFACDSRSLRKRLEPASFRFIHIDGSHLFQTVSEDVRMATQLAIPGSWIVVDDFRAPHTPGVAASVWSAHVDGLFQAKILTANKFYAQSGSSSSDEEALSILDAVGLQFVRESIGSSSVFRVVGDSRIDTFRWGSRGRRGLDRLLSLRHGISRNRIPC